MAWRVEQPEPAQHHCGTPPDTWGVSEGATAVCDECGKRRRLVVIDHGHDVMPGESRYEKRWVS